MIHSLLPPRVIAFLTHLAASILLALLTLALVFFVWYPAPLDTVVGVREIFFLILGVDVVIGPLMTLVVYRRGKKTLKFDLATIIVLQLAAFAYGLYTVAEGRPAWLVFNVDRFDLVRANELDERNRDEVKPEYRQVSWFGPRWVAARIPENIDERNNMTLEAALSGPDLPQRPKFYLPIQEEVERIRGKALSLGELDRFNSAEAVAAATARWPDADAWLPMKGRVRSVTVLINRARAEVIAVVDLKPWDE